GPAVHFPVSYSQTVSSAVASGDFLAVSANDTPVLLTRSLPAPNPPTNQVSGYELRVTITAATLADGSHPSSLPVWLDTSTVLATALPLGQPSSAFPLDSYLKNVTGPVQLSVAAFNPYDITLLQSLTLQLDVCQGDPAAGGTILKTLTETVTGDIVTLIVPG